MKRSLAVLAAMTASAAFVPAAGAAPAVDCRVEYGGQEHRVSAPATTDPYRAPVVPIGRRFLFKVVWVAAPEAEAGVNVTVYRATDEGPSPLHQAKFRPPLPAAPPGAPHGFTGLHFVYEPTLEGELRFWCGWAP